MKSCIVKGEGRGGEGRGGEGGEGRGGEGREGRGGEGKGKLANLPNTSAYGYRPM